MPTLKPGESLAGASAVPESLVREEAWGEVWRGRHDEHGKVFLILYKPGAGAGLLAKVRAGLDRWKEVTAVQVPGRLTLHGVFDTPAGAVAMVHNPGGRTLREAAASLDAKALGRAMAAACKTVQDFASIYFAPIGVTPDTIIEDPEAGEFRWKLLPIAPGVGAELAMIGEGRYAAPELKGSANPEEVGTDVYALCWIWAEALSGKWDMPREVRAIREGIRHTRLKTLLASSASPHQGKYAEPRLMGVGIDRWLKKEAAEDIAEIEEAEAAKTRKPWQQFLHQNRVILRKAGIAVGSVLGVVLFFFVACQLLTVRDSVNSPRGVVNLYLGAIVKRDFQGAKKFVEGPAELHTDMIAADLARIESSGLTSRLKLAIPDVRGSGSGRTAKVKFLGEEGDDVLYAEMNIIEQPDKTWRVRDVFYTIPAEQQQEEEQQQGGQ